MPKQLPIIKATLNVSLDAAGDVSYTYTRNDTFEVIERDVKGAPKASTTIADIRADAAKLNAAADALERLQAVK